MQSFKRRRINIELSSNDLTPDNKTKTDKPPSIKKEIKELRQMYSMN